MKAYLPLLLAALFCIPPSDTCAEEKVPDIRLTYEAFALPIAKAGEIQRKGLADADLYKELLTAGTLERFIVLRTQTGQRAVIENVTGYQYPVEFTQPQVPCGFAEQKVQLPIVPTAFEKLDLGDTFEVEPTLSGDGKLIEMQFSISHTALVARDEWGQGLAKLEQPQINTQKMTTNIAASVGIPHSIGTLNPVFGNGVAKPPLQNVWFCFITPTVVPSSAEPAKKAAH